MTKRVNSIIKELKEEVEERKTMIKNMKTVLKYYPMNVLKDL